MKIKELRERRGMTQTELARAMEVKNSSVAQWENNEAMPAAAKLPKLAAILECSIDALYGREANASA